MGSNTKGAAPAQSDNTLKKHKYKIKGIEKVMTVLPPPRCVVLGGCDCSTDLEGAEAPSYNIK